MQCFRLPQSNLYAEVSPQARMDDRTLVLRTFGLSSAFTPALSHVARLSTFP